MSESYRFREERKKAEQAKRKEQKKSRKGTLFRKIILILFVLGIVTLGAGAYTFATFIKDVPPLEASKLINPLSTKFYDSNGKFLYEYGTEKRTQISYEQVPKNLENAFISIEDSRFFEHHGVDIKRTAVAIFKNVTGEFGSQGGSTITQQVIKNFFLTPEKTVKRKVQEWYLAYQLEQEYSKQEIFMMYVNKIFLGNRSYGVAAAAKNYYGIDAEHLNKLTLPQAALIAGLTQSPNRFDPTKPENIEAATARRNLVLSAMHNKGYISEKQMQEGKKVAVTEGIIMNTNGTMPYEAFLDAAVKEVETKLKDVDISKDGLSIYLTLDPKAQKYADRLLHTNELVNYPNKRFQAAFAFIDTKTGAIRAIGSGRNDSKATFRGYNFAVNLKRQSGSTFKPILDYGPAIEYLKWSTYHQIHDKATNYSTGQPLSNWDRRYHGMISIRSALQHSYNIPALLTLREVGLDRGKSFAEKLGIKFRNDQIYESYAIGSNTVSPIEMAGAYSAFGNNGVFNKPHFVQKVVFPNGKVVSFTPEPKQVMHDYTAYMITDMLRDVVDVGTGKTANIPSLDVAGKTGTTNFDQKTRTQYGYPVNSTNDSWFVGYTPQYTMAVWTGYAQNGPGHYMTGDTTKLSQVMFKKMMVALGTDTSTFTQPDTVYKVGNDLYIKGSTDVPPKVQPIKNQGKQKGKKKKGKGKKHKKK
ncbi:transglycosylase domain-containing protein [Pseudoneobacillus sp. C159]